MAISPSRRHNLLVWILGASLLLIPVGLVSQVVRGPYTQLPSLQLVQVGSVGSPSYSWVTTPTAGFYAVSGTQIGVAGTFVPGTSAAFDLGGPSNQFRNLYLSGSLFGTISGQFADGSSSAPSIAFASTTTLGLYKASTTLVGVAGGLNLNTQGSAGAPSITWTANTGRGLFYTGGNIGVSGSLLPGVDATYTLGSGSFQWTTLNLSGLAAIGSVRTGDGNSGAPAWAFTSQTGLGLYRFGTGTVGITGHLLPATDNTFDLGTTATANAFRNGYFKGTLLSGLGIQIGATVSTPNAAFLRSEYVTFSGAAGAGMLGITNGDQSALGDLHLNQLAAGPDGDVTFGSGVYLWDFQNLSTLTTTPAGNFYAMHVVTTPAFATDDAFEAHTGYFEMSPGTTANFTGSNISGLYGASFPGGTGTFTEVNGVIGDAEINGTGATAAVFSFGGICCSFDPGSGTPATVTRSGFYHALQPFSGSVPPVTHSALWIEDQTAGGTFTPSVANYWLEVDTNGGTHNTLGTALGLLGLWGATPTATSPLKVGATMSSTRFDDGNSGTTKTIDLSTGNVHKLTLTGNVTITLTNPSDSAEYYLEVFTGTGSFTVTWPSSVKWPSGTGPTITVTASRMDLIRLVYDATSGDYWGTFNQVYTP